MYVVLFCLHVLIAGMAIPGMKLIMKLTGINGEIEFIDKERYEYK